MNEILFDRILIGCFSFQFEEMKIMIDEIRISTAERKKYWSVDLFVEVLSKQNKLKEAKSTQRIDAKISSCYF
jgi:hypothetical protein